MLTRVVVLVGLVTAGGAVAQAPAGAQQWLCIADAATGFVYDKPGNDWRSARFNIDALKYVVRRPNDDERRRFRAEWVAAKIGERVASIACRSDFDDDAIECGGMTRFTFNRQTLRYQVVYAFGYVQPQGDEGEDTPRLEIGKCSPL